MSTSVVGEAAIRRVAREARKQRLGRISTDDASQKSREHPAYRPGGPGKGVLAALAQAGIRLSPAQRSAIDRLLKHHPELASQPFTPTTAVERLLTHGVQFTDAQLELASDETTVSGFRRIQSAFDDDRTTTASHPAHRPAGTRASGARRAQSSFRPLTEGQPPERGLLAWLRRLWPERGQRSRRSTPLG